DDQLCGSGDCRSIPPRQNEESSVSPYDFSVIPPPVVDDTGILTSTKSDLPILANSKPRRERPPTKKKKIEGKTLVNELDSCLETSAKYMLSMPSADIAGILSSTKSGLPTLVNSNLAKGDLLQRRRNLSGRPGSVNLTLAHKQVPSTCHLCQVMTLL
ncbi:hypothetical protein HAX54_015299, partial [Datura stramonium]|nr:hypothetical protein [Datura stramonium]